MNSRHTNIPIRPKEKPFIYSLWLQDKRLTEAGYLISKGKKPSDIYLDVGFENLSHFYTSFKNKFGITPIAL